MFPYDMTIIIGVACSLFLVALIKLHAPPSRDGFRSARASE